MERLTNRTEPDKAGARFEEGEVKPGKDFTHATDWWELDHQERAEIMRILMAWVPELVERYQLHDKIVPPCWYRHEPLIQELLSIYELRKVMIGPLSPPNGANEWHFALWYFKGRAREFVNEIGCNVAEHFEGVMPAWVSKPAQVALWETDVSEFIAHQSEQHWGAWAKREK